MNNIIKYGAIGVGAYLLYRNFFQGVTIDFPSLNPIPAGNAGQTSSIPSISPGITNNNNRPIRDKILAMAIASGRQDGTLTVDEWNWYFNKVTGKVLPAPEDWGFTGDTRLTRIWLDNYLAIANREGLAGIGLGAGEVYRNFGLGQVVPTTNFGVFPAMGNGVERSFKIFR